MATLGVFCGFAMTNMRSCNGHYVEFSCDGIGRRFVAVQQALQ